MYDRAGDGDSADALGELAAWLRAAVARTGLTHEALAGRMYRDRTAVSQAMSGATLPSLPLIEAIAAGSGADVMTARRLWAAAREAAALRARRAAEGWPSVGVTDHSELCRALGALVAHRRLSLRQLVDLDETAVLTRTMTSYVLRGQRCVTYQVMTAILGVCRVSPEASTAWRAEWERLAAPEIAARRAARLEGLRASQGGRLYWMGWTR